MEHIMMVQSSSILFGVVDVGMLYFHKKSIEVKGFSI